MTNALVLGELAVSTSATTIVATSVNAEPLLTALIGFGISLVTIVGGELIKFLVAFLKNKREKLEGKKKDEHAKQLEEADEIVEVVQAEHEEE